MEAVLDETPREFALPAASVLRPFPPSVLADDSRWLHAVDAVGRHGASPGLTGQTPLGAHSVVYRAGSISLRPRRHGQAALRTQVYTLWARRGWTCPRTASYPRPHCRRFRETIVPQME